MSCCRGHKLDRGRPRSCQKRATSAGCTTLSLLKSACRQDHSWPGVLLLLLLLLPGPHLLRAAATTQDASSMPAKSAELCKPRG